MTKTAGRECAILGPGEGNSLDSVKMFTGPSLTKPAGQECAILGPGEVKSLDSDKIVYRAGVGWL